ncbi:MAG: hypothetical protein R3202_01555, partial [Candidatus Competibacterales bacterium]|nr:hypothetical protein [Candidatus Competibacterales bacterium]
MTTSFPQRLLAETVRQYEAAHGQPLEESDALAAGRAAGGDLEQRLAARAEALSVAPALRTALQQVRQGIGVGLAVLVVLALLAGVSAARLAFWPRPEQPLNVYWLLASLLGPPLLALLLWVLLLGLRPAALGSGSLGALTLALGRSLNRRLHADSLALDAALRARS